jgi:hypothetical protein
LKNRKIALPVSGRHSCSKARLDYDVLEVRRREGAGGAGLKSRTIGVITLSPIEELAMQIVLLTKTPVDMSIL